MIIFLSIFILVLSALRHLHSVPTRRSSDLRCPRPGVEAAERSSLHLGDGGARIEPATSSHRARRRRDRKSTRLNSSHVATSYAVFCLKKKYGAFAQTHVQLLIKRPCYVLFA